LSGGLGSGQGGCRRGGPGEFASGSCSAASSAVRVVAECPRAVNLMVRGLQIKIQCLRCGGIAAHEVGSEQLTVAKHAERARSTGKKEDQLSQDTWLWPAWLYVAGSWPPEWPPWTVRDVRISSLSWSPVTESNRRPSPYHGHLIIHRPAMTSDNKPF
jgi:hypothetical protein